MPTSPDRRQPSFVLMNILSRLLAAIDYFWRLVDFEITYLRLSKIPFGERLRAWARGFFSDRAVLYDLDDPDRARLYVSDARRMIFMSGLNAPFGHLLTDKLAFWALLRAHTNHGAPLDGVIRSGRFFPCESVEPAGNVSLTEAAAIWHGRYLLKPQYGSGGRGIYLLEVEDGAMRLDGATVTGEELALALGNNPYLLCRLLHQAEYAQRIFPGCANTMRMLTIYDDQAHEAVLVSAAHRFGREGMLGPVDNWNQGGLAGPVDIESGVLGPVTELPFDGKKRQYSAHPDTGAAIEGVVVPGWQQLRTEILALAKRLGYMPYIGWDVLMTESGYSIVEANNNCGVTILQVGHPLLANRRLREFYVRRSVIRPPRLPRPSATSA